MSTLTDIKRKICELEGGAFQDLCDALLSRSGYEGIHAYGMHSGTMKTTIGNPDTYFKDLNGKYIFVAYTTQKEGLFIKAKEDIEKCLDSSKTGVEVKDIAEIIFCHTSSNLSPGNDKKLDLICKEKGILFKIYGVDKIADEIYRFHKILSKDHLGLSIDTNQIMDYKTFVEKNDANEMVTPLSTVFQFREKECTEILTALNSSKVIVVLGQAGVGKSRISLEVVKKYGLENNYKILCVRSTDLPIFEDIVSNVERPGKYLIFIDDANELKGLNFILEYLKKIQKGYDVKIIATMRDYTSDHVIRNIKEFTSPYIYRINRFTDDEVKSFLDVNMDIRNPIYVNKIIKIAEGNPRIAYMAGRLAKKSQNIQAIQDATNLYENYYGSVLDLETIFDKNLCFTMSIIALLHSVNLDEFGYLDKILKKIGITTEEFKMCVKKLFELEFVDIKLDKVAIISDQCLGNYMLLYCFFKKKYLLFSELLEDGFKNFKTEVIEVTNTLLNIFSSDEVHNYINSEIKKVWDIFENESEQIFCEFAIIFHDFRPLETLLFVKDKIDQLEKEVVDVKMIQFQQNRYRDNDIILNLLKGYSSLEYLKVALELICEYVNKKPNIVDDAYDCIKNNYSINQYSGRNNYQVENLLVSTLKINRDNEVLTKLFLGVAEHLTQTEFYSLETSRGNNITRYTIPLILNDGCKSLRKDIWDEMLKIVEVKKWQDDILHILQKYAEGWQGHDKEIILFDQSYINSIVLKLDSVNEFIKCELYNQLLKKWRHYEICVEENLNGICNLDTWTLYCLFLDRRNNSNASFDELEKIKKEEIARFSKSVSARDMEKLIKNINDLIGGLSNRRYEFINSVDIFVSAILPDKVKLEAFLDAFINNGYNIYIQPKGIISELIILWGEDDTYNYICEKQFPSSNQWKFVFFELLSSEKINKEWTKELIKFLSEDSDKSITSSVYRNLIFLEKYLSIDSGIFSRCAQIILEKKQYNSYIVKMYFTLFFNNFCYSPIQLYEYFNGNEDILKRIYFLMVDIDPQADYDGTFIKYFISVDISWLNLYTIHLFNHPKERFESDHERIACCWELNNFNEIFEYLFENFYKNEKISSLRTKNKFLSILNYKEEDSLIANRQGEWIKHTIHKNYDTNKIIFLFDILSEMSVEVRVEALKFFVSINNSFEVFSKLPLESNQCGGLGSMVPYMQAKVKYYELLLPIFSGLTFLQHKKLIQYNIDMWKKMIAREEIDEIMEKRF